MKKELEDYIESLSPEMKERYLEHQKPKVREKTCIRGRYFYLLFCDGGSFVVFHIITCLKNLQSILKFQLLRTNIQCIQLLYENQLFLINESIFFSP